MLDELIELVLELVLEGSEEMVRSRKVPTELRIIAGIILAIFTAGMTALGIVLLVVGIRNRNWIIGVIGAGILAMTVWAAVRTIRKIESQKTDE